MNFAIHDAHVELVLGGQLDPGDIQPLSIALREINENLLTCEDVDPAELAAEEAAAKAAAADAASAQG